MWQRQRLSSTKRASTPERALSAALILGIAGLAAPIAAGGVKSYSNSTTDGDNSLSGTDTSSDWAGGTPTTGTADPLAALDPECSWPSMDRFQAYQGLGKIGVRADQGWLKIGAIKLTFKDRVYFPNDGKVARATYVTTPIFGDPFETGEEGWYYVADVDIKRRASIRFNARIMDPTADGGFSKRRGQLVSGWMAIYNSNEPPPEEEPAPSEEPAPEEPTTEDPPSSEDPTTEPAPAGGQIWITADNNYTLYVNGQAVLQDAEGGSSSGWMTAETQSFQVGQGDVVGVMARNFDGPAGMIAQLNLDSGGSFTTGTDWRVTTSQPSSNWLNSDFDDSSWQSPAVLGDLAADPWGRVGPVSGMPDHCSAQWIWAPSVRNDQHVWMRTVVGRTLDVPTDPEPPTDEPAPTDGSDPTAPPPPTPEDAPESGDPEPEPAPSDEPTIEPGSGDTSTPTGGDVGSDGQVGYDATAIARWNAVPMQYANQSAFHVGVVAFHINGIDRVEFSLDGGTVMAVTEMSLNPRTQTFEYYTTIDTTNLADGLHEVQAQVFPSTAGQVRVLAGPLGDNRSAIDTGEHSFFFYSNAGSSIPRESRYVSPAGDDSNGDGSLGRPFRTIYRASRDIHGAHGSPYYATGGRIFLMEGNHSFSGRENGQARPTTDLGWLTVEAAPGANRDNVVIGGGSVGLNCKFVAFRNLTLDSVSLPAWNGNSPMAWTDGCVLRGRDRWTSAPFFNRTVWSGGMFATNTHLHTAKSGFNNWSFLRGCLVSEIGQIAFESPLMAVNCAANDVHKPAGSDFHPDFLKLTGARENVIAFGLLGNEIFAQGIFSRGTGTHSDIALVNVMVDQRSHFSQWLHSVDHLLIWNTRIMGRAFRIAHSVDGSGNVLSPTEMTNVSIRDSVFKSMAKSSDISIDVFRNNHFEEGSVYGFNARSGVISDPAADLANRISDPQVPCDLQRATRGSSGSIGPIEYD